MVHHGLQTSAAMRLVKALQMFQLQKAISAVGIFLLFEAMLQDGLECSDGFREAEEILKVKAGQPKGTLYRSTTGD